MTNSMYLDQPSAIALWKMKPHEFNEWRATNDLPLLFEHLASRLPGFKEWRSSLPFGLDVMLRVASTAQLFIGESLRTAIKREVDVAPDRFYYECVPADEIDSFYTRTLFKSDDVVGEFLPYFAWAKENLGRNRFFIFDDANKTKTDTFLYGSHRGATKADGSMGSRAILFREFPVLKLGETTLTNIDLGRRNLDFVDLDHLTLTGQGFGSGRKNIHFSSCNNIRLIKAEAWFFNFHQCSFNTIHIENSNIQGFYFYGALNLFDRVTKLTMILTGSRIYDLKIKDMGLIPIIKDCELLEVSFTPSEFTSPGAISTTYRMLRFAYQASGQRQEASECYYNERKFERKAYYRPYSADAGPLCRMIYRGLFSEAKRAFDEGLLDKKGLRIARRNIVVARMNLLWQKKKLGPLLRSKGNWFSSVFQELLWGYGERPMRVVRFMLLAVAVYAWLYHAQSWPTPDNAPTGWLDDFYFSAVTFTTLGYGDIVPATNALKLICASEALIGGLSLGLIVAGFSNKGRY